MRFTQSQIDEMELTDLCDTIELIVEEKNEQLKKAEEIKPKLVEFVTANVDIAEEEAEDDTIQAELVRTDSINHQ